GPDVARRGDRPSDLVGGRVEGGGPEDAADHRPRSDLGVPDGLHGGAVEDPVGATLLSLPHEVSTSDVDEVGRGTKIEVDPGSAGAEHVATRGLEGAADGARDEVEIEHGV